MSSNNDVSMVTFLAALASGAQPPSIPRRLCREAERALRSRVIDAALGVDDLLSTFFASVLEERRRGAAALDWGSMTESEASKFVGRRLRQLACDLSEDWNSYRALRSHVKAALVQGLPPPPVTLPDNLCEGDRLSATRVASAAAWVVAEESVPATVRDVTSRLRTLLFFRDRRAANDDLERPDLDTAPGAPAVLDELDVEIDLDASRLAGEIVALLGERDARLFARRLEGWALKDVGEAAGLKTTAAFEHARRAERAVSNVIRASRCSPRVARAALSKLVETAA